VASLGGLAVACGPAAPAATAPVAADPFEVVRATSEAAYQSGKAHLERGENRQACIDLDKAKTNDPDNRAEIQQALETALARCLTETPTAAPTSPPRAIPISTLPPPAIATPAVVAPASTPLGQAPGKPAVAASPNATAAAKPVATRTAGVVRLNTWQDPQGRFGVGAPADWPTVPQPQSLFGTAVVTFSDPSGRAAFDVAVDTASRAVSPELFAASLEIAMQQQLPGYASEQVLPGTASGNPSIRRVFTFARRDASGRDMQTRGCQVTVLKGSTPYILTGLAPAEQYQQFGPTFDQMIESFRFS
jgi:hypothetical protein